MIVGHEITHGFDDQGSKFDSNGNLMNWWTPQDKLKYNQKIDIIRKQYAEYSVENHPVNSNLTLGENIADIGGLALSYRALILYLQEHPEENNTIDNMSPEKKFFIGYANLWKSKARKEHMITRLNTDPHSPPEIRVNAVIRNIDSFYDLFNIKPDNKLYLEPSFRARIWG